MTEALKPDDTRDALRKLGGLLLGVGALMVVARKETDWGAFWIFLTYAIPAVILYGGALWTLRSTGGLQPWQAVFSVFGLLFVLLSLQQLVDMIGDAGDSGNAINVFWTFGIVAGLALYAGAVAGIRFHLLLGSLAFVVSFMALWQEIIGFEDDLGIFRGMLGIASILLLVGAVVLWRSDRDQGLYRFSEVLTAAGVAAVISAGLGVTSAFEAITGIPGFGSFPIFETSWVWDTLLLIISLALVGIGTRIGVRGPVYVGAIGLALFLALAGADLDSDDPDPTKVVGWPLILLLGGAGALLASLSKGTTLGDRPRNTVRSLSGR